MLDNDIRVNIRINYNLGEIQNTKKVIANLNEEFNIYLDKGLVNITPAPIFNMIKTNVVKVREGSNCKYSQLYEYSEKNNCDSILYFDDEINLI